jgi:hypothetical protein
MKRTLALDEDDLIMVVKQDVVEQIDANRGEMNRTEYVNYLIQTQLEIARKGIVTKDEVNQIDERLKKLEKKLLIV